MSHLPNQLFRRCPLWHENAQAHMGPAATEQGGEKLRGPKVSPSELVRVANLLCLFATEPEFGPNPPKSCKVTFRSSLQQVSSVTAAPPLKEAGSCHHLETFPQGRDAAEEHWNLWLRITNGRWRTRRLLGGFILGWTQWGFYSHTGSKSATDSFIFMLCPQKRSQERSTKTTNRVAFVQDCNIPCGHDSQQLILPRRSRA